MDYIVPSLEDLGPVSKQVVDMLEKNVSPSGTVVILSGPLGAGKTSFAKSVGKILGISLPVVSPTFNLMKVYDTSHPVFRRMVHIDAYRLEGDEDVAPLRLGEYSDMHTLVLVEWGEKISTSLPKDAHIIRFSYDDGGGRILSYEK